MKLLKRGCRGEEVKLLQAMLGLKTNGSFDAETKNKLIQRQTESGVHADGNCGMATWKMFGFTESKSDKIYVRMIPFAQIEYAGLSVNEKNANYTLMNHTFDKRADIAINAGIFNVKKVKSLWNSVSDIVVSGKLIASGKYSNNGIAFENGQEGARVYQSTTDESACSGADFIGGSPAMILNGKPDVDMKGLEREFYNQFIHRMAIGFDEKHLYIFTTGKRYTCRLSSILTEGVYKGLKTLINLDGGENTAMTINGKNVFGGEVSMPSAIVIKLKKS
jgi:exopolysaccharide biosynthesis protein